MRALGLLVVLAAIGFGTAACTTTTTAPFDARAGQYIHLIGSGQIAGSVNREMRGSGQGDVDVVLIPVTAYSRERMELIFGGERTVWGDLPAITDPWEYTTQTKKAAVDRSGTFRFDDVYPEEYFLFATATWKVRGWAYKPSTKHMFERVALQADQRVEVALGENGHQTR